MNVITITGRLGQHPEMSYSPKGNAVTKLSVANNTGYGEYENTTWFNVECWNQNAEYINQYGSKGRQVAVTGEMVCDEYVKDGVTKKYWKIQFAKVEFLDKAPDQEPSSQEPQDGLGF